MSLRNTAIFFKHSFTIIIPFTKNVTSNRPKVLTNWRDRQLCTAMFSPEPACIASFPDEHHYEKHVLESQHIITSKCSSMDTAKMTFGNQMKPASKEIFPRIG